MEARNGCKCLSQPPLPLVFEMGSHWTQDLLTLLDWLAVSPRNPPDSTSRAVPWVWNSGPHACMAGTALTEPSSQNKKLMSFKG